MNIAQSLAKVDVEFDNQEEIENLHGGMSTKLKVNGEVVGYMGILHPMISQKIDKKGNIGLVEFDFDKFMLFNKPQSTFKHFTKFQAVDLDFNFVVPENLIYADIEKQIALFRCKFDVKYSLKDVYKNEKVLGNKTSMTFGFNISSKDHTLTANEIDNFSKRLIDHMKQIGIELR